MANDYRPVDPMQVDDTDTDPWAAATRAWFRDRGQPPSVRIDTDPISPRERSRDALLLAFAGLVIIALLAYVAGRAVG
jgi:hypothetical protein